jgi:UDP-glucose 4-epimerase
MANKKKIIVTGGAGFIGSHTAVELFNAGYLPVLVDNFDNSDPSALEGIRQIIGEELPFYQVDCNDKDAFRSVFQKEGSIEGVIHFAANKAVGESVKLPLKYYRNNIGSLVVLLEIMDELKLTNLVFSSSCTVYGQPDQLPVNESSPVKMAESPYGNTKQISEEILRDTVNSDQQLKAIALRYFNPVGAHKTALIGELPLGIPNNLVPFITQTAAGIREQLSVFGGDYNTPDGTCIRDYIHVVDLAKAHVKALNLLEKKQEPKYYDVFNVGTGQGNSVLEAIKAFEKASGQSLNYKIVDRRPGDIEKVYGDVSKATDELGWKAELNIEDAMADAWRWQQALQKRSTAATS